MQDDKGSLHQQFAIFIVLQIRRNYFKWEQIDKILRFCLLHNTIFMF